MPLDGDESGILSEARELIVSWLEQGREAYADAITSVGLPTVVSIPLPVVSDVRDEGSGFTLNHEHHEVSTMSIPRLSVDIHPQVALPGAEDAQRAAALLYQAWADKCRFRTLGNAIQEPLTQLIGREPLDFDVDPIRWLIGAALGPMLLQYVSSCEDLSQSDRTVRDALVDEALAFLAGDSWQLTAMVPVAGLRAAEPISFKEIRLRPLSPVEMGDWSSGHVGPPMRRGGRHFPMTWTPPLVATHVLQFTGREGKLEQPQPIPFPGRFLLALQLMGFEPGGFEWGEQAVQPEWAFGGRSGFQTHLPRQFEAREITEEHLAQAHSLASGIGEGALSQPRTRNDLALHRFSLGLRRKGPVDRLIDLTIALEALFLPGVSSELSFRFRLHGALWLGDKPTTRHDIEQRLKAIYDARSRIVHGEVLELEEATQAAANAQELARIGLLKAQREGWPTPDDFRRLALGVSPSTVDATPHSRS